MQRLTCSSQGVVYVPVPEADLVHVAIVQHPPVYHDRDGCFARAAELVSQAAADGAQLVVFPEAWLPGFPLWIFRSASWEDGAAKRAYADLAANALEIPSAEFDVLRAIARDNQVTLVMGATERDTSFSGGTLYNSIITIGPDGDLIGVHRKLMPTHAERLVWGMGDGSHLVVHETPVGRLGGLVSWEHWMPLSRHVLHSQGEQLHVALWPDAPEMHQIACRHYAFEGRCFVVCAATYMTVDDIPTDFELCDSILQPAPSAESPTAGVLLPGGSGLIGPDGQWIIGPVSMKADIIHGTINLHRIIEEQFALDTAGHSSRPDVFDLVRSISSGASSSCIRTLR
jgi:nitrilase